MQWNKPWGCKSQFEKSYNILQIIIFLMWLIFFFFIFPLYFVFRFSKFPFCLCRLKRRRCKSLGASWNQLKSMNLHEQNHLFEENFCICKLWEPQKDNALIYFGQHTDTGAPHMHRIKWIGASIFGVNLLFHIIRSYKIIGYKEMKVLNYRMIPHSHFLILFSSLNFLDESLLIVWL